MLPALWLCQNQAQVIVQDWGEDNEWQPAPSHSSPSRTHSTARSLKFGSPAQTPVRAAYTQALYLNSAVPTSAYHALQNQWLHAHHSARAAAAMCMQDQSRSQVVTVWSRAAVWQPRQWGWRAGTRAPSAVSHRQWNRQRQEPRERLPDGRVLEQPVCAVSVAVTATAAGGECGLLACPHHAKHAAICISAGAAFHADCSASQTNHRAARVDANGNAVEGITPAHAQQLRRLLVNPARRRCWA